MRILLVSPGFPDPKTAYVPGILETLEVLATRHDIVVHTLRTPPAKGVHAFGWVMVYAHGDGPRTRRMAALLRDAVIEHRVMPFDLVWSIWPAKTGLASIALSRTLRAPLVCSLMGGELAALPELGYGEQNRRGGALRVKAALTACRFATVGSRRLEARLREQWPSLAVERCPLGVDTRTLPERARVAWSPGLPLRVLIVSDLSPVKRVPLALEVLSRLVQLGVDVHAEVYGASDAEAWSLSRAGVSDLEGRLEHRGFVRSEDLRARLGDFDLLLHASAHEAQGIALIEAALADVPIACFDVGVAAELAELGAAVSLASAEHAGALVNSALAAAESLPRPGSRPRIVEAFGVEASALRLERAMSSRASRAAR